MFALTDYNQALDHKKVTIDSIFSEGLITNELRKVLLKSLEQNSEKFDKESPKILQGFVNQDL